MEKIYKVTWYIHQTTLHTNEAMESKKEVYRKSKSSAEDLRMELINAFKFLGFNHHDSIIITELELK